MRVDISIIIPYKNEVHYLNRCLASIFNKSYENIQVIVVDDHSTKNTNEFTEIIKKYPKVELYKNTSNSFGAGAARNIALEKAKGKWLIFCDIDDYFVGDWYSQIADYIESDADIVYFIPTSISELNDFSSRHIRYKNMIEEYHRDANKTNENNLRYEFFVPWSKMIKRNIVVANNINFDDVMFANDSMFSVKCGYYAKKIETSNNTFYCVVKREGSLVMDKSTEAIYQRSIVRCKRYNYVKNIMSKKEFKNIETNNIGIYTILNIIQMCIHKKYSYKFLFKVLKLFYTERVKFVPNIGQIIKYCLVHR